jgi:hypothetical protein
MASDKLSVVIADQSGGKAVTVEVPANVEMRRLVPALVRKLGPADDAPYEVQHEIQHKQSGRQLQYGDTLAGAGVKDGDTLRLLPNVTAGAFS